MKKIKDAVIIPKKLLADIILAKVEVQNEIIWHLLRYGLELEGPDPRFIKYEDALNRANTEFAEKPKLSDVEYNKIITHLNEKTGKRFRADARENRRWMDHPITSGYTVDDMLKVIDIMSEKWMPDPKMHQYLRPETLFGNKFGGYLNSAAKARQENGGSFETEDFFSTALERAYGGKV